MNLIREEEFQNIKRLVDQLSGSMRRASDERPLTFGEFASEYLETKLANPTLRSSTKASFENQVRMHLIPAFGLLPLERIKNGEWLQWVTNMRAQKRLSRFFNARKCLVEILSAARNEGHIQKLPKVDNPDAPKDVGRVLEQKEILSILWHARRPFRFIFYVFWRMGCRPREILSWEWSMIRWGEPGKTWIDVPARISKTDRSRSIPLNPGVSRRLAIRHRRGNGSDFVFPARGDLRRAQATYQSAWTTACRRARVKAVPYDLRRTFITRCAADGKPLIYVAKTLDTSSKMIEATYAKSQAEVMEGIVK